MAHPAPEAIAAYVEKLSEQRAGWIAHVLRCSMCRDVALAQWPRDPYSFEPGPDDAVRFFDPEEAGEPEVQRQPISWEEWEELESLLTPLLQLEARAREVAVLEPRFHRPPLLDLILAKSEAAQAGNPRLASDLAWLAVSLARASDNCERLWWAYCLAGNASRLQRELEEAERCFDSAALCLPASDHERGVLCRMTAILRWERGFTCDAVALLRHAAELFVESTDPQAEYICFALLGLLHTEEGEHAEALGPLLRSRNSIAAALLPSWLTMRAALSLALVLARGGEEAQARRIMAEAAVFRGSVEDPLEILRIQALEGRLAAQLGEKQRAAELLDAARLGFLANRWVTEATVASLELTLLFIESNRREDVDRLVEDLEKNSTGLHGREGAVRALRQLADDQLMPRLRAQVLASTTRRMFRFHGIAEPVARFL